MKRYPKLRYPGHEEVQDIDSTGSIVITEKLDGSNFRFTYTEDDGYTFGSRNTFGDSLNCDQFSDPIAYVEETCDVDTLVTLQEDYGQLVVFGEAMLPHTISYEWEQTPLFVGFDVWNIDKQVFHHTEHSKEIIEDIGLPFTPIIDEVAVDDLDGWDRGIPQSAYYDGKAEGIVMKNHDTSTYCKIVRDDFKEKRDIKFGGKNRSLSDTEKIVEEYVTPARVESVAHQLVDDGEWNTIELPMMEILPEAVLRDTMAEEGGNLVMQENVEIDTGELRSQVSKRCVGVIKHMMDKQTRQMLSA